MIEAALEARLKTMSSVLDKVLSLENQPSQSSNSKSKASTKKSGLVSALKAHYGGPASSSTSAKPAATSVVDGDDGGLDVGFDDDEDGGVGDIADAAAPTDPTVVYAPTVLANASSAGSILNWVVAQDFNKSRNRYEAVAIGAALDALLEGGTPKSALGIEMLCRRLTGVHLADQSANWDLCKAVEYPYASQSLLDQRLLAKAIKDAAAIGRLRDRTTKKAVSKPSFNRRGLSQSFDKSSNQQQSRNFNTNKSNPGVGSKSAGAAQR